MTRWKMVPVELTPEIRPVFRRWSGHSDDAMEWQWSELLEAAPEWEPSEEDVERALETFCCVGPTDKHAMRAALKAAFEEGK